MAADLLLKEDTDLLLQESGDSIALSENVAEYWPRIPQVRVVRAPSRHAVLALACAFVPLVAAAAPPADAAAQGDAGALVAAKVVQYQALHAPIAIPAAAQAVPDQWWPIYPNRIASKPRINALGRTVFETVPEPPPPAADAGIGGDVGALAKSRTLFYQSVTGPVAIPAAVVAPNLIVPVYPIGFRQTSRPTVSAYIAPLHVPDVTDPVPNLSWKPTYSDVVFRAKKLHASLQRAYQADRFDAPAAPTVVGGGSFDSGRLAAPRVLQYQGTASPVAIAAVAPFDAANFPHAVHPQPSRVRRSNVNRAWSQQHFGVLTEIPVQAWESYTGLYPARVPGKSRLLTASQQAWASDRFQAPGVVAAPEITPPVYPSRVYGLKPRSHGIAVVPSFVPDVTNPVTALSWLPRFADRVNAKPALRTALQRAYQADRFDAPTIVVAPDLSWGPEYPDSISPKRALRAALQQAYVADRFDAPALIVVPLPVYPDKIYAPKPRLAGIAAAPVFVPDVTHQVTSLSWRPEYPDRIIPARSLRAPLQQAYTADKFDPPGVVATPDLSWSPEYQDRIFPRRALTLANQRPTFAPLIVLPPTDWGASYPDTISREAQVRTGYCVAPVYVADVTVVAPVLSWRPEYPAIVFPVRKLRTALQRAYQADRFDVPGVVEVPDLSWLGRYADRVDGKRPRYEGRAVVAIFVPDVTQPVTALAWSPEYPDRIIRPFVHPSDVPSHWWPTELIPITHIAVTELSASYILIVALPASYIPTVSLPASVE